MKRFALGYLGIFILLFTIHVHADQFLGTGSRWPVTQLKAIATDDTCPYFFVGDGNTISVFQKSDLTRKATLRLNIATEGIRALVYDTTPENKVLYAACGNAGVRVIDVSDPLNPDISHATPFITSPHISLASYNAKVTATPVRAYDITIHKSNSTHYAFVADPQYGLRILDLSAALSPKEVGYMDLISITPQLQNSYNALKVDVYSEGPETNVYAIMILKTTTGPVIARISVTGFNKSSLTLTRTTATSLPSSADSISLLVKDRYAYCLDSSGNYLLIYDLLTTNANAPELVYPTNINEADYTNTLALYQPRGLYISGNYLYVTSYNPVFTDTTNTWIGIKPGLNIIDIANPISPAPSCKLSVYGTNSVIVLGNDVYMTSHYEGIYKMSTSTDKNGSVIIPDHNPFQTNNTPIFCSSITVVNKELVFTTNNQGKGDSGITLTRVKPLEDSEGYAITDTDSTNPSNIACPALPLHENFMSTPGQANAFCIKDNYMFGFVADGTQGLQFVSFVGGGLSEPVLVPGYNIPTAPYSMIDVAVINLNVGSNTSNKDFLAAITTDPNNELWIVDVTSESTNVHPVTKYDLKGDKGDATAQKVTLYKGQAGLYALIANGTNGLDIILLNPDSLNPGNIILPPADENKYHVNTGNALKVYADSTSNGTGIYAYVADGVNGVKVVRLYKETNFADMNPEVIASIDISSYATTNVDDLSYSPSGIRAIDVHFYHNHLYVLTDNPCNAVLLYDVTDPAKPVFKGFTSSYGQSGALFATDIVLPCASCTPLPYYTIKGVFIADGNGGIAFRQVTDTSTTIADRTWPDTKKSCFIASTENSCSQTGLFPVFVFLFACLGLVVAFSILIKMGGRNKP